MDSIEALPQFEAFDTIWVIVDRLSKYSHFVPLKHPFNAQGLVTRRDHEVVDFTWSRVKNNTELTNFEKLTRIDWHNGK